MTRNGLSSPCEEHGPEPECYLAYSVECDGLLAVRWCGHEVCWAHAARCTDRHVRCLECAEKFVSKEKTYEFSSDSGATAHVLQ